jgi:zinc resistance-associated protein
MEKARLSLVLMLALVLSLSLASSSWARMGMGGGPGAMNLTPEQAGQLFDLRQKFMNETTNLRKEMWLKKAELAALWRAEAPDEKQIRAKQKEMNALKDQMQEKALAFRMQARKIAPQGAMGMGPGCGMGMGRGGGMGAGMGPGPGMDPSL